MPLVARGYDCSYDPPDQQCMWNAGYRFMIRYASRNPDKNLTKAELDSALRIGLKVCVVWQEGSTQMTRGYSGGQTDARDADAFVKGLGLTGIPVIFACDQDFEAASSSAKTAIDEYCKGAISVIGLARMGGYGDDSFCKRQFDGGRITYGMQTYAWSEGMWESRAQIRQVKNNFAKCGGYIDDDEAWAEDYGQWPRPASAAPASGGDFAPSSVYFGGALHLACVWDDGRVNYRREDESWYAVDPVSANTAKSGADITVTPGGTLVITYTNASGRVCTWQKAATAGRDAWAWQDRGGPAR